MFAYTSGGPADPGYAIAYGRFVCLVSSDALTTAIHLLYDAMRAPGASADSVVQVLHSPGSCERFALVETPASPDLPTVICLRGDVHVDLGGAGSSKFSWPPGSTWITGHAFDVAAIRVSLGQPNGERTALPLESAVVRATDVATSSPHAGGRAQGAHRPLPRAGTAAAEERESRASAVETHPAPSAPARTAPADERGPADRPASVPSAAAAAITPPSERAPAVDYSSPIHAAEEETVVVAELIRPPAEPSPAALLAAAAGIPAEAVAQAVAAEPASIDRTPQRIDLSSLQTPASWVLRLPDGNELEPSTPIVVGRRPWRNDPDETTTYYILAPSPGKEISGKHLEFSVVGDELTARDLESTNGTLLLTPHKPPRLLHGGGSVALNPGDTLDLGEGFKIEVGEKR